MAEDKEVSLWDLIKEATALGIDKIDGRITSNVDEAKIWLKQQIDAIKQDNEQQREQKPK